MQESLHCTSLWKPLGSQQNPSRLWGLEYASSLCPLIMAFTWSTMLVAMVTFSHTYIQPHIHSQEHGSVLMAKGHLQIVACNMVLYLAILVITLVFSHRGWHRLALSFLANDYCLWPCSSFYLHWSGPLGATACYLHVYIYHQEQWQTCGKV